jgi:hypothetical protein
MAADEPEPKLKALLVEARPICLHEQANEASYLHGIGYAEVRWDASVN